MAASEENRIVRRRRRRVGRRRRRVVAAASGRGNVIPPVCVGVVIWVRDRHSVPPQNSTPIGNNESSRE
eukprot:9417696-Pyramimonas_sp.AAC.1